MARGTTQIVHSATHLALQPQRWSQSLSLSAGAGRDRAKSETGLSSPVPEQQRSSSCFPVCSVCFPIAHLPFVCLSRGGGSFAQVCQVHAEQVVDSELVSQLWASRRRWIAKPCLGAHFRARTAAIREQPHTASTTGSADRHTDAVSLFTGPAIGCIGPVPAYWGRSDITRRGRP